MAHISEKSLQSQGASSAIRRGARHMASEYWAQGSECAGFVVICFLQSFDHFSPHQLHRRITLNGLAYAHWGVK